MLVDSHCHLDFPNFAEQLPDVVARANNSGVGAMLTICTHLSRFEQVLSVAERFDSVFCTVGVHPHEAAHEGDISAERLIALAAHPKVVGLGETGLDYYYQHSPREAQKQSFLAHVEAARTTELPLVIHTRDADQDMASMLTEARAAGPLTGVLHCFSSGPQLAETAVQLGFYISFSGIVTFKKADGLRDVAAAMPADRILVETDAPYLAPVPMRGQRNEPAFVAYTAAEVAKARGIDIHTLHEQTTENFFRLFAKATRPTRPVHAPS